MNCRECKNLLIEYAEGSLDGHPKEGVEQHLEQCPECRKEIENICILQDRLLKNSLDFRSIDLEESIMDRIARERCIRLKAASSAGFFQQIRSLFMKNAVLKIAAAAVVVLAVLISFNFFQSGISFAQVAEPVLHARTIAYDVVAPDTRAEVMYHDIVADGKIRRSLRYFFADMILDVDNSKMLGLDPSHKTAAFVEAEMIFFNSSRDFLRLVRSAVGEALNDAPSAVEKLGPKTIDSRDVVGYRLRPGKDNEEVVIWADPDKAIPVQIDIRLGASYHNSPLTPIYYTLRNIEFDVPVDKSLMELPPGYSLIDPKSFTALALETSFLKTLNLWTTHLLDGAFPKTLKSEDLFSLFMPEWFFGEPKLSPEERKQFTGDELMELIGSAKRKEHLLKILDYADAEEYSLNALFGFLFINSLEENGGAYEYSGYGVRLGEETREIFRYKMPDSSSWRVVYGDLHVEELPAENAGR